ncbi:phospholipase C, phosphocholine-specific [Burkholderia pseudomallei MSHR5858]|nr:phospholipase C, phosphocholine-specific [Burkholderia pseudomallei MSHR5858]
MTSESRRRFLHTVAQSAGAAAALTVFPESIRRALAIPAASRTGTLRDVEHIVVFMQENRSFDHYFGHLRGVRGYNDRFPIPLPNGKPVWYQPSKANPGKPVLPFRLNTLTTSAQCIGDLDHSWYKTHAAIDGGRYDQWPANKTDMTMGYHVREDIPFHYALADAFTVCDNYFCSLPGPTHPNRSYLMTGTVDPTGRYGGPLLDNSDYVDGDVPPKYDLLTWTTYPERLEANGISWQIYQQGTTGADPLNGNYGTNILQNFANFINAKPGSSLYRRAQTARTLDDLKADVLANKLPQVSWLLPPAAFSEHPRYTPAYGANYTSQILDALTSNPDVWRKTVLFIMYDENDGFFDHVVPPQPATTRAQGLSTVTVDGEIHDVVNPGRGGSYTADGLPYGLGPRVPMTVVSPWTKGGFVCSQVFDHTSVIRFIAARFGIDEPNITPWRRAVCGDLTSAFDFRTPDATLPPLPDTSGYRSIADQLCSTKPAPAVPAAPSPVDPQEPGVRPARAALRAARERRGARRRAPAHRVRESRRARRALLCVRIESQRRPVALHGRRAPLVARNVRSRRDERRVRVRRVWSERLRARVRRPRRGRRPRPASGRAPRGEGGLRRRERQPVSEARESWRTERATDARRQRVRRAGAPDHAARRR